MRLVEKLETPEKQDQKILFKDALGIRELNAFKCGNCKLLKWTDKFNRKDKPKPKNQLCLLCSAHLNIPHFEVYLKLC